jgi:hypothetical protein
MRVFVKIVGLFIVALLSLSVSADVVADVSTQENFYHLEVGVHAGVGYYTGELERYVFSSMSESYGIQARCKIDRRWSLQVKGIRQRVISKFDADNEYGVKAGKYQTPMWHMDLTGEYNFFPFGWNTYDVRVKNVTPYISLGLGMTVHNTFANSKEGAYPDVHFKDMNKLDYAMYIPVGVGLKWRFADRWHFEMLWQHNLYMLNGDGMEGVVDVNNPGLLDDSYQLNGSNVMNNDVTSTFTLGVVFEFAAKKRKCPYCNF